jgi:hypothetical protein
MHQKQPLQLNHPESIDKKTFMINHLDYLNLNMNVWFKAQMIFANEPAALKMPLTLKVVKSVNTIIMLHQQQ